MDSGFQLDLENLETAAVYVQNESDRVQSAKEALTHTVAFQHDAYHLTYLHGGVEQKYDDLRVAYSVVLSSTAETLHRSSTALTEIARRYEEADQEARDNLARQHP
ncbi:hypothetical protein [Actinophytocola sediminis]